MAVKICFSRLREGAVLPSKRPEDAGYDIYACFDGDYLLLRPLETLKVPTGIASACPAGYYFQVFERGSTGTKGLARRCGVIDSGYRGEWFLPMTNLNAVPLYIAKPDAELGGKADGAIVFRTSSAIAQAVLLPVPETEVEELPYEELEAITSERGRGNLGSSGK